MAKPIVVVQITRLQIANTTLVFWHIVVALVFGIVVISFTFSREIRAAIEVWDASTAYSHCYLVLPMALYLLWERREAVSRRPQPEMRFMLAAVPLTLFWLVAERLGIMEARQLAAVAAFELLFLTVLGWRLYWLVCGPLLFLFFLVPFGAFVTPALQQFTAAFSIFGLDMLGIPNFSDRFTIETPAGIFFVAEACAGLRFLIAAIAFGVFYSLLSYTSYTRRLLFIAASVVVPIVANGFRALGIVVLGQVLGSAEAAAADHIVYGWLFFSVVMLLLIAGGHVFREVNPTLSHKLLPTTEISTTSPMWCVAGLVLLLALGPASAGAIDSLATAPALRDTATIVVPGGCSSTSESAEGSPNRQLILVCDGTRFDVRVSVFAARSTSSAMISERRRVTQEIGAENAAVSVADVPGGAGYWTIMQTTDPNRVTAYAGWVDGIQVSSSMAARIAQAHDSVFGASYAPALITITSAEPANSPPSKRRETFERLSRLLSAQSDLNFRVAVLTKL